MEPARCSGAPGGVRGRELGSVQGSVQGSVPPVQEQQPVGTAHLEVSGRDWGSPSTELSTAPGSKRPAWFLVPAVGSKRGASSESELY